jgi:hypothetical protein
LAAKLKSSRLVAPYFETWSSDSIATIARRSGDRYFTLAFLETLRRRSLQIAVANGVRVEVVNPMVFDDYDARAKGMSTLAMWSIQRDNSSSGIAQSPAFSHVLAPFTGP